MTKEKIIKAIIILNTIAIVLLGFIFLIGMGFTLLAIFLDKAFLIAMMGYILALIFGLLAYKKSYFLWISFVGWLIFGFGNSLDTKSTMEENNQACIELRQDKNCIEKEAGTMDCVSGENLGIYPKICKDLKK